MKISWINFRIYLRVNQLNLLPSGNLLILMISQFLKKLCIIILLYFHYAKFEISFKQVVSQLNLQNYGVESYPYKRCFLRFKLYQNVRTPHILKTHKKIN